MHGCNMKIILEEKDYILVHKEAFVAAQSARLGEMDLYSEVRNYLAQKYMKKEPYLALINRLDQPVEGLVLFAKNKETAAKLSAQLQNGTLEKYYLAAVYGEVSVMQQTLTDYIRKNPTGNYSEIVSKDSRNGKEAILEYRVIRKNEAESLLEIHLLTGRHHQIRVQLSHAGYPLLGDIKYGNTASNAYNENKKIKSVALCAYKVVFQHPVTGNRIEKEIIPMQEELQKMIKGE